MDDKYNEMDVKNVEHNKCATQTVFSNITNSSVSNLERKQAFGIEQWSYMVAFAFSCVRFCYV